MSKVTHQRDGDVTARALDQFLTRPETAQQCVGFLRGRCEVDGWLWVEPSAGAGAFLDAFPNSGLALDIAPRRSDILSCDFLSWRPPVADRPIAVVGNPPFGKNASLARRFFNHAAGFADLIAFILPRTFEKPGFVDRLDRHMHLSAEMSLDPCSFELDGALRSVPVVFQIWERRAEARPIASRPTTHPDFAFVAPDDADFAFQRVGARAGFASVDGLAKSPQSHYFVKAAGSGDLLLDRLSAIDWTPIKTRTAGNPSIGKAELVEAYRARHG